MDISYKCKETGITGEDLFTLVDTASHIKLSGIEECREIVEESAGYLKRYGKNWAEVSAYFTEHLSKCRGCKEQLTPDADLHYLTLKVSKDHPEIWD